MVFRVIRASVDWDNRPRISDMPIKYSMNALSTQYSVLQRLNKSIPENVRVPDVWFEDPAIKFIEPYDEDITNFFFYFVQKDDFRSTLEYNIELLKVRFGSRFYVPEWVLKSPIQSSEVAYQYEPGIHVIRTNLIDGWVSDMPIESPDLQIIEAKLESTRLIGTEGLSIFALQNDSFLKKFDGIKFPKFDLLGLQIDNIGCTLSLCYGQFGKNITLTAENIFIGSSERLPLKLLFFEDSF